MILQVLWEWGPCMYWPGASFTANPPNSCRLILIVESQSSPQTVDPNACPQPMACPDPRCKPVAHMLQVPPCTCLFHSRLLKSYLLP